MELSVPYDNGVHEKFVTLYIVSNDIDNDPETLEKGRYIKQEYINRIFQKIKFILVIYLKVTKMVVQSMLHVLCDYCCI